MIQEHIVDIILAALVVLITVRYYRQGLVETVFKFGSYIVALVAARVLCGTVTDWIYSNTKLFGTAERYLAKLIVFVLIYIAVRILFTWIIYLLKSLNKLPVIKQAAWSAFGPRLQLSGSNCLERRLANILPCGV